MKNSGLLRRIARDQRGSVIIFFTIMLPVMMGLVGLALEGGRLMMLHSQLQNLADAASLAGANELDGQAGAIQRAKDAAESMAAKEETWWSNVALGGSQIAGFVFYSEINPDTITTSDTDASFIKVTTVDRGVLPSFLIAVGASEETTHATATAGSEYVACNIQPLMMCNPTEPTPFTASAGDLFGFTVQGSTNGMSPGDFNLLDPPGKFSSGAPDIEALLSASSPQFCFVNKVSPAQGQKANAVQDGINVRFDIPPSGNPKNVDRTPAPDVIKGDDSNNPSCKSTNQLTLLPQNQLPGATGQSTTGSSLMGGSFDTTAANAYWAAHHGGTWPIDPDTGLPITRFQAYVGEINGTYPLGGTSTENLGPHCSTKITGPNERRILAVAIVNCNDLAVNGNSIKTLKANTYAEFFLTRPVGQDGIIWAEFIKTFVPNEEKSKIKHIVQLYRDK